MFSILCTGVNVTASRGCCSHSVPVPRAAAGTGKGHSPGPQCVLCLQGGVSPALLHGAWWLFCFFYALSCPWQWYLGRGKGACI